MAESRLGRLRRTVRGSQLLHEAVCCLSVPLGSGFSDKLFAAATSFHTGRPFTGNGNVVAVLSIANLCGHGHRMGGLLGG